MKCPRCYTLCAQADLASEPVTFTKTRRKVIIETDSHDVWLNSRDADALGLAGKQVWMRDEVRERICRTCVDAIRQEREKH